MKEKVQAALDQVRPNLQRDGGDVELVDVTEDGIVKVRLTGRKAETKEYQRFTGYPGGRYLYSYKETLEKDPGFVVREAVRRMLPKTRLGRRMITKLKTFPGADHTHQAQRPSPLTLS